MQARFDEARNAIERANTLEDIDKVERALDAMKVLVRGNEELVKECNRQLTAANIKWQKRYAEVHKHGGKREQGGSSSTLNAKQTDKDKAKKAKTIAEYAKDHPDKADEIATESINAQYTIIKKEQKQEQTQEKIIEHTKKDIPSDIIDIYSTDKRYRVIYADPPWAYQTKGQHGAAGTGEVSGAAHEYPTMSIDDICDIPVKEIAEPDSVLFLWTTSPHLYSAMNVIEAWGFVYKANCVWNKLKHNVGYYYSVRHEHLLLATRGSCTPDSNTLEPSVIEIERTEHSRKPAEFRQMIDRMYQYGNRIELFAREQTDKWDRWGNE